MPPDNNVARFIIIIIIISSSSCLARRPRYYRRCRYHRGVATVAIARLLFMSPQPILYRAVFSSLCLYPTRFIFRAINRPIFRRDLDRFSVSYEMHGED